MIFLILAGIVNAVMDVISTHHTRSIFKVIPREYADPAYSWPNKYKNGDPNQGEKFFLSSTMLVPFTDMWHLCKAMMLVLLSMAVITYKPLFGGLIEAIIIYMVFTISFEASYRLFRLGENIK